MENVIAISGTPGTGKTALGNLLSHQLDAKFIELSQVVTNHQFHFGEDTERETLIADIDRLQEYLTNQFQDSDQLFVVTGHFADLVPKEFLRVLVVLRCHPLTLIRRLAERNWSSKKILENIQAEILGECTSQGLAKISRHRIFEIDTTNATTDEVVTAIESILSGKGDQYSVGKTSWLRTLDPQLIHKIMEKKQLPSLSQKA
ncbi:MAG: adenylate kinase family protein [Promethearchaeota archaeon]